MTITWMNNAKHETKTLARPKMYNELGHNQRFMDQTTIAMQMT